MLGFPISRASFVSFASWLHSRWLISNQWQQAGRAGRRSRDSLAIFVADPLPVDQYYMRNPLELFNNVTDDLVVDLDSHVILEGIETILLSCRFLGNNHAQPIFNAPHMKCHCLCKMRFTLALVCVKSVKVNSEKTRTNGKQTFTKYSLLFHRFRRYHPHPKFLPYPSRHVTIREPVTYSPPPYLSLNPGSGGALEEKYTVVNVTNSSILEEVEVSRAMFELYEGGVVSSPFLSVICFHGAPLASFCTKAQHLW